MRLPRKGERGFTLIELLIVVAILGVLAAVVIPNVGRFIGRGEDEAADTEFANIQSAVIAMMTDNQLSELPTGTFPADSATATDNMSKFPSWAVCGTAKLKDPDGYDYTLDVDKDGYILYQHDINGQDSTDNETVNYVATEMTKGKYYVDKLGTVTQYKTGYE